jgi:hypothetical protein
MVAKAIYYRVSLLDAQAEVMRKLIQSKFPRTYRLLDGIRFQLPARRQADYPNHGSAVYWDAQLLMDGLTASRLNLLGDPTRWKPIAGSFLVTNEWLKLGQRTIFVERELGEDLKHTDLPEGFCPQDLRWRWNALRLVLPAGLFGRPRASIRGGCSGSLLGYPLHYSDSARKPTALAVG